MSEVARLDEHWKKSLIYTQKGGIDKLRCNCTLLLANGPFRGVLAYNEFTEKTFWLKTPEQLNGLINPRAGDEFSDTDHLDYVQAWLARTYGVRFGEQILLASCMAAARHNKVHRLRTWLRGLKWDGVKRLETVLADRFGVEPSRYASMTMTWWMTSAVARVYEPGCKADCMLILQGAQGSRKSSALSLLCSPDYFLDRLPDLSTKDCAIALNGKWIVEEAELEGMGRSELSTFKGFVSRVGDDYRPPYGKVNVFRARSCVFAATTNNEKIFADWTGNRRYWPHRCAVTKPMDLAGLARDREQLWAEAAALYDAGKQWHPTDDMLDEITEQQEERYDSDVWEVKIAQTVEMWETKSTKSDFTTSELLDSIGVLPSQQNRQMSSRIGAALHRMGYATNARRVIGAKRYSVYQLKQQLPLAREETAPEPVSETRAVAERAYQQMGFTDDPEQDDER